MSTTEDARSGRVLLRGLACLGFVAFALIAEVAAGLWANSQVPAWGELAPIAWPQLARVVWWSLVALAALTYRRSLVYVGLAEHRVVTFLTVAPFVVFAFGVAIGADWATWH